MSLIENPIETKTIQETIAGLTALVIELNDKTDYAASAQFDGRTDEFKITIHESKNSLSPVLAEASLRVKAYPFELEQAYTQKLSERVTHVQILLQQAIRTGSFPTEGLSRKEPNFELQPFRF